MISLLLKKKKTFIFEEEYFLQKQWAQNFLPIMHAFLWAIWKRDIWDNNPFLSNIVKDMLMTYSVFLRVLGTSWMILSCILIRIRIRIRISFIARYVCTYEEFVLVTEASQCNRRTATGQNTDNKKIIMYK